MMKVDIVFQGVCRICLSDTNVSNLFQLKCNGMPVSQLLDICIQHQPHVNDGYPQNMCMSCVAILFHTYNFITMCQKSLNAYAGTIDSTYLSKTQDLTSLAATQDSTFSPEIQLENLPERNNYIEDLNLIKEELIDLDEAKTVDLNLIKFENPLHELNISDCDSGSFNNVSTTIKSASVVDLEEEEVSLLDGSSDDELAECDSGTPPEIVDAPISTLTLIPERSRKQYEIAYKRFKDWCEQKDPKKITENVLVTYFLERSKQLKPSSLWTDYSMLKTSLAAKDNIDIRKYVKLTAFLKRKSIGYRPKIYSSRIFTREEFYRFLSEAPDERFLLMKVVVIFGIAGGMGSIEFPRMTVDDVKEQGSLLLIKLPQSKANRPRSFIVSNKVMIDFYLKYKSLRPPHTKHDRFFVNYRKGQCSVQAIGVNTFGKIPCQIAQYLGLNSPHEYSGHCFRKSSATLRKDARVDIFDLQQFDGWKASTPAIKEQQEIPRESDSTGNEMMIWNSIVRQYSEKRN